MKNDNDKKTTEESKEPAVEVKVKVLDDKKSDEVKAEEPKKNKLSDMHQTHAMEEKPKYEPTTLDQVWGDDGLSKYSTMDPKVYGPQVNGLSLADLKTEAIRVGLLPVDNPDQLRDRLKNEFMAHINSFRKPLPKQPKPVMPDQDVLDILKEGR